MIKRVFDIALLVGMASLVKASGEAAASTDVSCDLGCKNGGYCTLVEGTVEELSHEAQSGHLIEECVCQPGFTGTACETVVEECSLPERKCHNGASCTQNADGEWGCDCSMADSLSAFAGYQCRNPVTEYCTGKYDPNSALSFCTNGGRCEGDFLAAKVAPGDTSFNKAYQHRGCRCPREFYGPHCEFLKFTRDDAEEVPPLITGVQSPATAVLLSLMSLSLLLLAALLCRKLRARRVPREITIERDLTTSWGNGYRDSWYNGRHVRPSSTSAYNSRNLHVETVFEDAIIA